MKHKGTLLSIIFIFIFYIAKGTAIAPNFGDTTTCLIVLELEQMEDGTFLVSMTPDTTWEFPLNIISTAQITIKAPTGQLAISDFTNLIDGVVFFETNIISNPIEAIGFDYISIGLGSQGTTNIPFQKGQKVELFSFVNSNDCTTGTINLMDNATDPFFPPNELDVNVGQQMTIAGFNLADVPIGIGGTGIECEENTNTNPTTEEIGIQVVKQDITCFGFNDGLAIAKGNGGTLPYSYLWSTGDTLSTIEGLAAGTYIVTLTDANGFSVSANVEISAPMELIVNLTKTDLTELDANDGSIQPVVMGGTPPYSYNWNNGSTVANQTGLSPGIYSLTITDANNCMLTIATNIENAVDCPNIDVMIDILSPLCTGDSTGALEIIPQTGTAPFSYLWETGDTIATLSNIPSETYQLIVADVNGCAMTINAFLPDASAIEIELITSNGQGIGEGSIRPVVTGGRMPYSYIWSNGSTAQSINNLESGIYSLTITDANGCTQVASTEIGDQSCELGLLVDFGGTVSLDSINCSELGELCLPIPLDSMVNFALFLDGAVYAENLTGCDFDTFFAYTYFTLPGRGESGPYILQEWTVDGVSFSTEFQTISELVDSMNVWDATGNWIVRPNIVIIEGGDATKQYGAMTIRTPQVNALTMLDLNMQLLPTGTLVQFPSGEHELVLRDNRTSCTDSLQIIQPCRENTNCFSLLPFDTLELRVANCIDFSACIPLPLSTLLEYSILDNGIAYDGNMSTCENNGTVLSFSIPFRHELIFTTISGCQDTIVIIFDCEDDLIIRDTIEVGEQASSCVDLVGLSGPFQSVVDLCPERNGEMAMLTIDGLTGCIDYEGVELGQDTACIEVCDITGSCDTVTLVIAVASGDTPTFFNLDAVDDTVSTDLDASVVFNALGNDIFTNLSEMFLVEQPANGTAIFNMDGTMRYVPNAGYCDDVIPDTLFYVICESELCDTAKVRIFVECDQSNEFIIYNGLSPNGDGINDFFTIGGIEDLPGNRLFIYNRWGNMVYTKENYNNEWDGRWGNRSQQLPDGSYYYIFEDGKGGVFYGFLEIRR